MKKLNILYWGSTGLLSAMMLMSALMYFMKYDMMVENINNLGYPSHIIYPLAIAKIAGVITIITKKSKTLTLWAYAGFSYVFILAAMAHINAADGQFLPPIIAFTLLFTSYLSKTKVFGLDK